MRVTLLHNPKAGRGEYSEKNLKRALRAAGHKVAYHSTKERGWKKAIASAKGLIVVAGGDGTVGKVARELIGRKTSLSVLPLGTANNLARALGFTRPVRELIEQLDEGKGHGFDVGLVRGPWGKRYVFEGVGAGLLAEYFRLPRRDTDDLTKEEEMTWHVLRLRKLLSTYRPREWQLKLDGEELSDHFLLLEAMNIRSVGPVLNLAPKARTGDGYFDLVLARESERDRLMDYLSARLQGKKEPTFPLPARTFRRLHIRWKRLPLHLDDELWPEKDGEKVSPGEIEISVVKSALVISRPDDEG